MVPEDRGPLFNTAESQPWRCGCDLFDTQHRIVLAYFNHGADDAAGGLHFVVLLDGGEHRVPLRAGRP